MDADDRLLALVGALPINAAAHGGASASLRVPVEQSVATPQAAREDGLVHPADTSRSHLADAQRSQNPEPNGGAGGGHAGG